MALSKNKAAGLIIVMMIYIVALAGAVFVMNIFHIESMLWNALLMDVVATLIVFLFSYLLRNSSIYDPYWSVIPFFLAIFWFQTGGVNIRDPRNLLILTAMLFWGVRLTVNWASGWDGLKDEDWRYRQLAEKTGKHYWLTSLAGIHMLPTLIVFLACLPVYAVAVSPPAAMNTLDWIGFLIAVSGTVLEMLSDIQLKRYRKRASNNGKAVLDRGLWAWSRHPNYLGEITFWAGLFVVALGASASNWWTVIGLVCMVLLFKKVSIPMMEGRQMERKPGYEDYMKRTPALFPRILK